jgi:Protein of unknown function (DUF3108)
MGAMKRVPRAMATATASAGAAQAAPAADPLGRLCLLALLCAAVLLLHVSLVAWLNQNLPGMHDAAGSHIDRIDVAFVRELQPALPPPVVAVAAPPAPPQARAAQVPAPAASAASSALAGSAAAAAQAAARAAAERERAARQAQLAQATPSLFEAQPQPLAQAAPEATPENAPKALPDVRPPPEPLPPLVAQDQPALAQPPSVATALAEPALPLAMVLPAGADAPASAARFEWPLSTRLTYDLVGDYRGPVQGNAQVEWLRQGSRYQVHLDVSIGGGVVTRRLSSEGTLGPDGLQPLRYEEVTKAFLSTPRSRGVRFEGDRVILANGKSEPTLPQVQDTASQFVQLSWLFTTQSHRLKAGERIEVPLALPGRIDRWHYEVQAEDELYLPVGRMRAFHMKPRRMQAPPGELVVETWFAPSLQYLPVRILIRQDAQTFIDLLLSRLPQQAASGKTER